VIVALLVVTLGMAYLLSQVGGRGGTTADTASVPTQVRPSVTSSPEASAEPGATNPAADGSPAAPALTADQKLENFVKSYYSEVTKDSSRTWVLLTPSMQSVSGSRDGYDTFWRTVDRVQVGQIFPNASSLKAVVTLTIVGKDGRTLTETHQFTFVRRDGGYLIDSEKVLG